MDGLIFGVELCEMVVMCFGLVYSLFWYRLKFSVDKVDIMIV